MHPTSIEVIMAIQNDIRWMHPTSMEMIIAIQNYTFIMKRDE